MSDLNEVETALARIAVGIEAIVEQLELINSPDADRDWDRWYYHKNKRFKIIYDVLAIAKQEGNVEKIEEYKEELEKIKNERYKGNEL